MIKKITMNQVASYKRPATIEMQKLIVKMNKEFISETEKLQNIYYKKIAALDELKKSILQKAFEGKLLT